MQINTISNLVMRYRQDSGFPQTASSNTSGFGGGISVYTKPMVTGLTSDIINPVIMQNQNPNPRQSSTSTDASITTFPTFDSKTFIIFLTILAGIWFFGRG